MIPYGRQDLTTDDIDAVVEVLKSDYLTQGPKVSEFEEKFAEYTGATYAVSVINGTAALHIACLAMDVNEKSKVITSPITFAASANCVLYCGGNIDFVDVDEKILLDLDKLELKLSKSGKAQFAGVIPVQFAGASVDMERLKKICDRYNLWIIEDACHSPGGYFKDSKDDKQYSGNGKFADISIFSFHPVKHITSGEGGMLTTNSKQIFERLLCLRSHGMTKDSSNLLENHGEWYYELQSLGYNYRLSDIHCALGISQLSRAKESINRRKEIARTYDELFDMLGIKRLPIEEGHAYHLYIILTNQRLKLYNYLKEKKIFTQVHYIPLHTQPYYKNLGWKKGDMPNAEVYYEQCLSLPMFPALTCKEQSYVVDQIECFKKIYG